MFKLLAGGESRRSGACLLAKIGFDMEENEPCKVCPLSVYRSPRSAVVQIEVFNTTWPCLWL